MWRPPSLFAQPSKFTSSQLKELEAVDREERDRRDMVVPAWQGWRECKQTTSSPMKSDGDSLSRTSLNF